MNVLSQENIGKRVRVSTGEPMPPARFTRKVRDWKYRNYEGILVNDLGTWFVEKSRSSVMVMLCGVDERTNIQLV